MSWTDPSDITDRWVGEGKPDDLALVDRLIGDAEAVIVWEYPDIDTRVVGEPPPDPLPDDPLPIERVKLVVSRMVIRHLRNPEEVRQTTETTGPFSRNRTFAGDRPGSLFLTEEERRLLGYLPGAPRPKAFTVVAGEQETGFLGSSEAEDWSA